MEGEVGAQVATPPPIFFHQPLPGQFHDPKKRGFPWQFHHPQPQLQPPQPQPQPQPQQRAPGSNNTSNPTSNWNPKLWDWDSSRFAAKPSSDVSDALCLGTLPADVEQRKAAAAAAAGEDSSSSKASPFRHDSEEGGGNNLTLNLGGGAYSAAPQAGTTAAASAAEEVAIRPSKRVRSGSPGSGGSYPMCQVDDCRADLSNAKDYHRRHKVCEVHSKTTKALVGKQMQRFCQQCSRFHPLSEFDEGKRSCRRRLAGHNRRRRKTQPEEGPPRLLLPGNQENGTNPNLDLVSLLAVLARLQGNNNACKPPNVPTVPDRDRLAQILSKINSLSNPNSLTRLPLGGLDLNVSEAPQQQSSDQAVNRSENQSAPSTMNLLAVLSAALAASPPEALASVSQGSSDSSGNDKSKGQCTEPSNDVNSHDKPTQTFPLVGIAKNTFANRSELELSKHPVKEARPCLPLQLFGSSMDDSPPKMGSVIKYLSSESSNPMEERSPSSSPPVTQKLFPLHSEDTAAVEASTSHRWCAPLQLFEDLDRRAVNGATQNISLPAGYACSSGSDHSPSSSNSDSQDRTGRIIFKLFGKDPSSFPGNLRAQILNWLAHSPSDIESYIRPGCVVLSIYLSMPSIAWDDLEENLLRRVTSLVECSDSDFWRNGRFLIRTNRQLVSHKDGMVRLSKSWRTWSAPELISVSPLAIVGGQRTSLLLKGCNLTVPGTKIHCTFMGKYTSKEVLSSAYPGTIYDYSSMESFDFPGGSPLVLGRCFIEVENGFKGNSFPVIIANSSVCQELRTLETELEEDARTPDVVSDDRIVDNRRPRSREDILLFLNELGWLFQKASNTFSTPSYPKIAEPDCLDFSVTRFKYLFTFSVERDWCSVTKTLLDMLVKRSSSSEALAEESLDMLSEIHLLNRAVKRKCRRMVDLLLRFSVIRSDDSKMYPFPPDLPGPGGLTPLHVAASSQGLEDIVDALTDDPQEIGLKCWDSVEDDGGQSPRMYATLRNNHSYNDLVARKLADKKNDQISLWVGDGESFVDKFAVRGESNRASVAQNLQSRSCAQCAMMKTGLLRRPVRSRGLLNRPYIHSMLAIAAVCVCVCVFMRGSLRINSVGSFRWENLDYGPI